MSTSVSTADAAAMAEVATTLEALRSALDDLVVRGVRAAGPEHLSALTALEAELGRAGAAHVAERLSSLLEAIRAGERTAARQLLGVQTALRVCERVLSRDAALGVLTVEGASAGRASHARSDGTSEADDLAADLDVDPDAKEDA